MECADGKLVIGRYDGRRRVRKAEQDLDSGVAPLEPVGNVEEILLGWSPVQLVECFEEGVLAIPMVALR